MVEVALHGSPLSGDRRPSSEVGMHLGIYGSRPEVRAVVRAHPPEATGFAVAGEALVADVLREIIFQLGRVPLVPYAKPGSSGVAEGLARFIPHHDAFPPANHGATTIGPSLLVAHQRTESPEHAARILFTACQLGRVNALSDARVRAPLAAPAGAGSCRRPRAGCGGRARRCDHLDGCAPRRCRWRRTSRPFRRERRAEEQMTVTTENPMDAVAALMDERARYEAWLTALESRRASTPAHVYERVHADYQGRLRSVIERLAGRSSELQERVDRLREQATSLRSEEDAYRDERAEAELRAAVGEHTPEQWEEIRERCDGALDRLGTERHDVESELRRVQQILEVATSGSHEAIPAAAARGGARDAGTSRDGRGAADTKATIAQAQEAFRDPAEAGAFDELAFLKSVVGAPKGVAPAPPAPPADVKGPADRPPQSGGAAQGAPARGPSSPRASESPAFGSPQVASPQERGGTSRRPSLESVPAFLKDVPAEQAKTLRCQECGTMNYPTEWYCERCGGELAAM
jgi:hypothetical protein